MTQSQGNFGSCNFRYNLDLGFRLNPQCNYLIYFVFPFSTVSCDIVKYLAILIVRDLKTSI